MSSGALWPQESVVPGTADRWGARSQVQKAHLGAAQGTHP